MTALNWAAREWTSTGRRLLRENPLMGIRLPKEKNPERPVMSHDVYLKLLDVSPRVHALLPLALIVAEGTGRRISAWRNLVWDDIDFEAGTIHWSAEHDKRGYETSRDELFGAGCDGSATEGAGGDRQGARISVAEGSDQSV